MAEEQLFFTGDFMSISVALGFVALQGVILVSPPEANADGLAAEYGSGVCRISVSGDDDEGNTARAEFSRRLRDGNLSIALYGPFMQDFRDKDAESNYPVTVNFDTGPSAATRSGGYDTGGFSEYIWGGWGPGAASDAAYAQLAAASSFSVVIENNSFGPFNWVGTGAIHKALEACEYENS